MLAQINCKIDPFTISGSVLWTLLSPESRAATSRVSGGKDLKVSRWCLAKKNVGNIWTHGENHAEKRQHIQYNTIQFIN